jgi:hypothetical protein
MIIKSIVRSVLQKRIFVLVINKNPFYLEISIHILFVMHKGRSPYSYFPLNSNKLSKLTSSALQYGNSCQCTTSKSPGLSSLCRACQGPWHKGVHWKKLGKRKKMQKMTFFCPAGVAKNSLNASSGLATDVLRHFSLCVNFGNKTLSPIMTPLPRIWIKIPDSLSNCFIPTSGTPR